MAESKIQNFNHLKIHSQYSICEGAIKIDELKDYSKDNKIRSLGLCDTTNLCGALEFAEKISKAGTQPIIGTQVNFKFKDAFGLLPLYALNEHGYKRIIQLSSKSFLNENKLLDPHIDFDELLNDSEGVAILSGTVFGFFGDLFEKGKFEQIKDLYSKLKFNFKNRFYLEIQRHNDFNEIGFEKFNLSKSKELEIPIIATNEVFYLKKDMYEAHDALICIKNKTYINDKNRIKLSDQHYFKNDVEMSELFSDLPEALENNYNFPYRCNFKPYSSKPILPNISSEKGGNAEDVLKKEALAGLADKFKYIFKLKENKISSNENYLRYKDRLEHELDIIIEMKYASYFLIVSDYIKWAKKNDIPVGPGRGSGAGSLVAWCLSITDVDPIKFNLIFERFLNPDRISMPDFDIDFCEEKRDQVFEYLRKKYKDGVAHIITFGKLKARMALRDVGRVLGLPYGHVDKLCKMVPFDPSRPLTLQESIDREPRFKEEIKSNSKIKKLLDLSLKLEGLNRNMATHAAGVVIAGEKLSELFPLYVDHSSNLILPSTQFDMYSSENAGLVKFDLLGLKTLTIIDKTLKRLKKKNIQLDITKINRSDEKVFSLLSTGETTGLFQLESAGMREAIKQMKPNKFDDIIALVALYRPGPMSNIPIYNDCKNGVREPDYIHPTLKEILKSTYGIIIYQEQVMQIAQTLAGFTAGEADILRRAMGKKKKAELDKQKERFINGAIKNGIAKDVANFVFTKIEPFAQYGFNKSHAAAYGLIAYQTAYLKTYFKEDFIAATMTTELTNTSKLREFVEELKRLKVEIVRPSINRCYSEFKAIDGKIYYGLGAIKNVGFEAISNIVKERESKGNFKSLEDFINRVSPKDVNKLQLEGLTKAGVFDDFDKDRNKIFSSIPKIIQQIKNVNDDRLKNQTSLFENNESLDKRFEYLQSTPWTQKKLLSEEFRSLGFYISDHPLNEYENIFNQLKIIPYNQFLENNKSESLVAGTVMSIQEKKSSKGTPYAIIKFSDKKGEFELFLFSEILINNRDLLKEAESFVLTLQKEKLVKDNNKTRVNIKKISLLSNVLNEPYQKVTIELKENFKINDIKEILSKEGNTEVNLIINKKNQKAYYSLKKNRKFDLNHLEHLKTKEYVVKITF